MTHKAIYTADELSCSEQLRKLIPALRDEFLAYHTDFQTDFSKKEYANPINGATTINFYGAWTGTNIKYSFKHRKDFVPPEIRKFFPTAIALTNACFDDCPISTYSVIEPNGIIGRHTGPENRDGEFIRIHVPLIVPEGDIFFEVGGEVIRWDDIFGFDNQTIHSAYNYTNQRRLVYLIDIRRSRLGLPPGRPYDEARDEYGYPPFDPEPHRRYK
jgi:hypothetical protein